MNLLETKELHVELGSRSVLHSVSLSVQAGEYVGLIGPNGAGKSTLLRAVAGLVARRGAVRFAGKDAGTLSARERALCLSYLPQEREIAWPVSVERVVALGRSPHLPAFSQPRADDIAAVREAMRRMDIEAFASRPATELSGGEKARVLIARALAQDAPLMLADEPTAGLDPAHQIALMRLFLDIAKGGKGVLASLHDLGLAARWCTRLIVLHEGKIVADGAPRAVLTPELLAEVYGIRALVADDADGLVVHPLDIA